VGAGVLSISGSALAIFPHANVRRQDVRPKKKMREVGARVSVIDRQRYVFKSVRVMPVVSSVLRESYHCRGIWGLLLFRCRPSFGLGTLKCVARFAGIRSFIPLYWLDLWSVSNLPEPYPSEV
jgi:hypothetical protein